MHGKGLIPLVVYVLFSAGDSNKRFIQANFNSSYDPAAKSWQKREKTEERNYHHHLALPKLKNRKKTIKYFKWHKWPQSQISQHNNI